MMTVMMKVYLRRRRDSNNPFKETIWYRHHANDWPYRQMLLLRRWWQMRNYFVFLRRRLKLMEEGRDYEMNGTSLRFVVWPFGARLSSRVAFTVETLISFLFNIGPTIARGWKKSASRIVQCLYLWLLRASFEESRRLSVKDTHNESYAYFYSMTPR